MCHMMSEVKCADCPFVSCNKHPQFFLALQCAMRMYDEQPKSSTGRK